jgi:hypothetical protein
VREGEYYERPLRLICAVCSLSEGFVYDGVAERLAAQPILQDDGRALKLKPFQEADARILAQFRAQLVGHEMGCGKTPLSAMAVLRTDTGNLLFTRQPASSRTGGERSRSGDRISRSSTPSRRPTGSLRRRTQ